MDEKQLQLLWDLHAKNGGFSSFDQFKQLMNDNNARKAYFDNSNKELGFKDYSEFDQTLKKKETTIPSTNGLQTSSKTTPSVVETPSISEKEIPQVDLDQLQIPADNPVGDAEYVKFLDKQTKKANMPIGGISGGANEQNIPDANAIVYANKIRKKYKDNGIDLDQVSQELEGLPKGIEDVTIINADGSTTRPYSGETLSKERATDYLSYKNKVNALKNVYDIKLSKDPDKENKANLYSELQHTNLTGDLVTDVDRVNNNKNRQIDIIRSSTDDQEEQAKMINRVDENKAIWVEQNVPTPDLAKKYLDDKLTRLGVVMPSKNQKVYANDATFNGNVDNYQLEDIQKHLDPNNLIEQRIFDKYKNNKQLTDVISNSPSLDDAAIRFAAKQNPKIQAAMDVFGGDLPENLKGNLVEAFLNNEDVIRLSKTDPKIASLYEKTKNSMATKYPEWETNKVAQVISQYREDNDMNNWFANVPTLDGTDKVVEQLVKDGKLTDFDKNVYESKIRPQIGVLQSVKRGIVGIPLGAVVGYESPIKTPGLLENALTGYNKSLHNAAKSVEDFASYTNPSSNPTQKIDDANKSWNILQTDSNVVPFVPKGTLHKISEETGNLTGSIVPLIAGGALLNGVKGGDLINMALNFEGGNREKALTEFPDDPAKRYLYTALGTGIDMTLAHLIPIEKIGAGATKLFKNDIKGVINDLSNGTISNAVAKKTLLEKAATYFPELLKENAKTAGVMTGFGVFHNILDSVFGNNNMSSDDIAKDAVKQYKSTFLATPLLSALSVFGKNNKVNGKVLWEIGGNGDMYRKMLDEKLKANPDSQEIKDQLENLKNVVGVRKDLENVRIPEERKQKYLILSLNEDIWNRKASETKDELIKQKYLDKAEKFKSEKEAVYNNKDKAEEFKQYDNVEPETPSTPKEELPIEKTNTGTEVEPNLGEGRKPVTLSGNTEEERQVAIERRKKETKQTPMTSDRDKLLERINNYNNLPKFEKRKSTEANNIKISIDNFNKTHDQKYSVSANRDGSLDLRNNKDRRMKYSPSGNEGSIVENSKPLIERDENTQKVFNDLLDNDVLPSARRVNGEKMSESEHDATIQDIMDGIPSQRAENYLNSLEKQIKNDDFDYGNPDKNTRVTLKDALGITEEHGEPLPVEKVKEWLNTESELTPEDETTLDNIENLLTHYEQRHELPEGGISPKVQQPTQEGTGTISKPTEPNKPKEEVSNQANTETLTLDNNGNEVPPINKVEEVGNNNNGVGISHESLTKIANRLGIKEPEPGVRLSGDEIVDIGRKLLDAGADPLKMAEDFKNDKSKNVNTPMISLARAYWERLVKEADSIADKNSKAYQDIKDKAQKWQDEVLKPMATASSEHLFSFSGETDLETGSFTATTNAFEKVKGTPATNAEKETISKLTETNSELSKKVDELEKKLIEETDKHIGDNTKEKNKFEKKARKLADKIMNSKSPSWLKIDDGNIQKKGIGEDAVKRLLADATINMGKLLDKGVEFSEAVKEAVKDLVKLIGEDKRDEIEAGFAKDYKDEFKDNAVDNENKLNELIPMFAGKSGNKFTPEESKALWDYAKSKYLENGVKYNDMIAGVFNDLGLTWRQVSEAITSPKVKPISDEMYIRQGKLRMAQIKTRDYVEKANRGVLGKSYYAVSDLFRGIAVFAHGHIFIGTHAGMTIFDIPRAGKTFKAFFNGIKFAYGNTAKYEKSMLELKNRKTFLLAQRSGLQNDPNESNTDDYQRSSKWMAKLLGKIGLTGVKGFNAIKILRQDLWESHYNKLTDAQKSDPEILKSISELVNNATGATNINLPKWTKEIAFAANMEAARWEKLTSNPFKASKTAISVLSDMVTKKKSVTDADKVFAKVWASRVGWEIGAYASALIANAALQNILNPNNPVNVTNPSKSDFLKFKFGETDINPTSGMLGAMSFVGGLGQAGFGSPKALRGDTRLQAMGKNSAAYLRGKLSPFPATLVDIGTQSDFGDNPLPFSSDKPRTGKHKLSWAEYAFEKAPIPIADAAKNVYAGMIQNGMSESQANLWLKGLIAFAEAGSTGFRFSESHVKEVGIKDENSEEYKFLEERGEGIKPYSIENLKPIDNNGKPIEVTQQLYKEFLEKRSEYFAKEVSDLINGKKYFQEGTQDVTDNEKNKMTIPSWQMATKEEVDNMTSDELKAFLMSATSRADDKAIYDVFKGEQSPKARENRRFD